MSPASMSNATASPSPSGPASHLDNTYGAFLIGTFVSLILLGFLIHQGNTYFRTYKNDPLHLKILVIVILFFGSAVNFLCMHASYHYLVTDYLKPDDLKTTVWSFNMLGICAGSLIASSEAFFILRVYLIGPRLRPLVAIAALCAATELTLGFTATIHGFIDPGRGNADNGLLSSIGAASMITADILLTSTLTYVLHKSRTGMKQTDSLLDRLILYTVNTGLLMSVVNVFSLVFGFVMPGNLVYVSISIVDSMLYPNSVMAVLNARKSLTDSSARIADSGINMDILPRHTRTSGRPAHGHSIPGTIEIELDSRVAAARAAGSDSDILGGSDSKA